MARVKIYESDPLVMFAERIADNNDWSDWYEIPEELIAAHEEAETRYKASAVAIETHIAEHKLTAHPSRY